MAAEAAAEEARKKAEEERLRAEAEAEAAEKVEDKGKTQAGTTKMSIAFIIHKL